MELPSLSEVIEFLSANLPLVGAILALFGIVNADKWAAIQAALLKIGEGLLELLAALALPGLQLLARPLQWAGRQVGKGLRLARLD